MPTCIRDVGLLQYANYSHPYWTGLAVRRSDVRVDPWLPMIHDSVVDAIGGTPLIRLSRVMPDLPFTLFGKMEAFNPGGSAKDRPAARMLRAAMARGEIGPQTTVVESSSGNMAIGLAQACACLGLRL